MPDNEEYSRLVEQTVQAHIEMTGQVPTLTETLEIQAVTSDAYNKDKQ